MPAPNRRNRGASLAEKIGDHTAAKGVAHDGDRMVAARTRQDKRWEEAVARLSPAARVAAGGSDLERRAAQVRVDAERARNLGLFAEAVSEGRAKPPIVVLTPHVAPRYFLACIDCDRDMQPSRPEPRVPLCRTCRAKREARRVA